MFGHDAPQHQDNNNPGPVSDGALVDDQSTTQVNDTPGDFIPTEVPGAPASSDTTIHPTEPAAVGGDTNELLDIKQQALHQLTPLLDHLEQTPEEKFRTTMMMIQASDNDALLKNAYDAALQIPDEKMRAQALLDVVNEINYFTNRHNG